MYKFAVPGEYRGTILKLKGLRGEFEFDIPEGTCFLQFDTICQRETDIVGDCKNDISKAYMTQHIGYLDGEEHRIMGGFLNGQITTDGLAKQLSSFLPYAEGSLDADGDTPQRRYERMIESIEERNEKRFEEDVVKPLRRIQERLKELKRKDEPGTA